MAVSKSALKPKAGKPWTEGRRNAFITSALRSAFRRYPAKWVTLKSAFVSRKINKASKREAAHYKCASCRQDFVQKDVQVDHIIPVVGPEGFKGWDVYIERLLCEASNLQVLCTTCHKAKTKKEKLERV